MNSAEVFLEEEVRSPCENLAIKICDLPPRRCVGVDWSGIHFNTCGFRSPGNHPSEEIDIYCGEILMGITESTPAFNLLGSFEKGNSYNGNWGIDHVMVDPQTLSLNSSVEGLSH